jgi:hypothetical protein
MLSVKNPIQDGVGQRRIIDPSMPMIGWKLTGGNLENLKIVK